MASANDFQFELDDHGFGFDLGPGDGIGSQDLDVDLGIDFGDGPADHTRPEDETMSVEVGRDAAAMRSPRESLDSHLLGKGAQDMDVLSARSREASLGVDLDFGGDLGGMDFDLGLDFGDGTGADTTLGEAALGEAARRSPSRACKFKCSHLTRWYSFPAVSISPHHSPTVATACRCQCNSSRSGTRGRVAYKEKKILEQEANH